MKMDGFEDWMLTLSSAGFCGKVLLAIMAVCWWLHWSREENLDWYSDQRLSTSWWQKREDRGNETKLLMLV